MSRFEPLGLDDAPLPSTSEAFRPSARSIGAGEPVSRRQICGDAEWIFGPPRGYRMGMAVSVPQFTVDDLDRFPDDGNRYELLDGVLIVSPAPRLVHQRIATGIVVRLANAVHASGLGCVVGPGVITVPARTQLQPDILVYPAQFAIDANWGDVTGHWLAVEILSRSSRAYDRLYKRDAYFALGVMQVWLVDIDDRSVEVWRSRSEHETVRDVIRWRLPASDVVVPIVLAELFAGLP
jgi:Uma2 family endonuclease